MKSIPLTNNSLRAKCNFPVLWTILCSSRIDLKISLLNDTSIEETNRLPNTFIWLIHQACVQMFRQIYLSAGYSNRISFWIIHANSSRTLKVWHGYIWHLWREWRMRVCIWRLKRQRLAFSPVVITLPASLIFASVSKAIIERTTWILILQSGYYTIFIAVPSMHHIFQRTFEKIFQQPRRIIENS